MSGERVKSIAEMLRELGEDAPIPSSKGKPVPAKDEPVSEKPVPDEEKTRRDELLRTYRELPVPEKRKEAWRLHTLRAVPVAQIAKMFDVDTSTVYRWFRELADEARQRYEGEPSANVIMESLSVLLAYEEMCRNEIAQVQFDGMVVDPLTGKTFTPNDYGSAKLVKSKFMGHALKAREQIIALMIRTGIIPSSKDHLYQNMKGESKAEVKDTTGRVRTEEELRDDVMKLLRNQRAI